MLLTTPIDAVDGSVLMFQRPFSAAGAAATFATMIKAINAVNTIEYMMWKEYE